MNYIRGIVWEVQSGTDPNFHNDSFGCRECLLSQLTYIFVSTGKVEQPRQRIFGIETHRVILQEHMLDFDLPGWGLRSQIVRLEYPELNEYATQADLRGLGHLLVLTGASFTWIHYKALEISYRKIVRDGTNPVL
jgi:hypothetical protein